MSIDKIKSNIRWMNSGYLELNKWLNESRTAVVTPEINYRLPTDLQPFKYDILMNFQFLTTYENNSFPYEGDVTIYINCVKTTSSLVFHVRNLTIYNSTLSLKSSTDNTFKDINSFDWFIDYEREFFIANLSTSLKSGHNYTFNTKFRGFLKDDNKGFYRSSYVDDKNVTKWLMTSQLESTDARKSFPCFVKHF